MGAAAMAAALALLRTLGSRTGLATVGGLAAADIGPFAGAGFPLGQSFFGGGGGRTRRRRRRRALTASDRADIGFISGLLGPKAAKDFTVTLIAGLSR